MKPLVLIVEDSETFAYSLSIQLTADLDIDLVLAQTYAEAVEILNNPEMNIAVALVDLFLPDSEKGETIDLALEKKIPTVVMTAQWSDEVQEFIWTKHVVDYVVKEGPHTLEYISDLTGRLINNKNVKILIVDDSRTGRTHLRRLLELHKYTMLECDNGDEALRLIRSDPGIHLVLADYNMPDMDGFELTRNIRHLYTMNEVAVIGLSTLGNHKLSVQFIKHGANDFISKPFISEQLYCRVSQNIKIVEQYQKIKKLTLTDSLTQIPNRRYFFEVAPKIYNSSLRSEEPLTVAMIDIDFFKKVNDTYGHKFGDIVLQKTAESINTSFRKSDVVSRFGGEEFCVLAYNMDPDESFTIFERLREKIEKINYKTNELDFNITVSIGLCQEKMDSLEKMVREADQKLYQAKESGRNKIVV
ncbi:MAG: diguanylate cyclase [bacterium]|nr:diguanylate cyclase [bacterium]